MYFFLKQERVGSGCCHFNATFSVFPLNFSLYIFMFSLLMMSSPMMVWVVKRWTKFFSRVWWMRGMGALKQLLLESKFYTSTVEGNSIHITEERSWKVMRRCHWVCIWVNGSLEDCASGNKKELYASLRNNNISFIAQWFLMYLDVSCHLWSMEVVVDKVFYSYRKKLKV